MTADRTEKLRTIRDEVWNLTSSPLYSERVSNNYYPVLGEGDHYASIMFIGEAPGKNEAESGRPFCGAAGRTLDQLLESVSIPRERVYITNIVKDRPPGNRDPEPEELELYAPFLDRQIEIIQPSVIATLGRFSMNYILERYGTPEMLQPISKNHGHVYDVTLPHGTGKAIPLFHPAAAIYNTTTKQNLEEDFQTLAQFYSGVSRDDSRST